MSDNPFSSMSDTVGQPNQAAPSAVAPSAVAPTGVTIVAVFALILGIMGVMGSCLGGIGLAFQTFVSDFLADAQQRMPPAQKAFLELSVDFPIGVVISNIVIVVLGLLVGTALIVGGAGTMRGKEAGRSFLRKAFSLAMVYLIFRIIITVYATFAMSASLKNGVEKYANDPMIYNELKQQLASNSVIQVISTVIGLGLFLVLMGFYFWARRYLNRENVVAYFAAKRN